MITIEVIRSLKNNDGLTLKGYEVVEYKSGWQVADHGTQENTPEACLEAVKLMGGNCGIWLENGIYYVDHSFRIATKKEALKIGRENNQISIFGWSKKVLAYC